MQSLECFLKDLGFDVTNFEGVSNSFPSLELTKTDLKTKFTDKREYFLALALKSIVQKVVFASDNGYIDSLCYDVNHSRLNRSFKTYFWINILNFKFMLSNFLSAKTNMVHSRSKSKYSNNLYWLGLIVLAFVSALSFLFSGIGLFPALNPANIFTSIAFSIITVPALFILSIASKSFAQTCRDQYHKTIILPPIIENGALNFDLNEGVITDHWHNAFSGECSV